MNPRNFVTPARNFVTGVTNAILATIIAIPVVAGLALAHTIKAVEYPEPEERCFPTASRATDYCRSQEVWE